MANKMFLVTPEQFHAQQQTFTQNPYSEKLKELEQQLRNILDNNQLDAHQKMILYSQTLQEFLNFKNQEVDSKKLRLEIPLPPPPPPTPPPKKKQAPPPPPPPPTILPNTSPP